MTLDSFYYVFDRWQFCGRGCMKYNKLWWCLRRSLNSKNKQQQQLWPLEMQLQVIEVVDIKDEREIGGNISSTWWVVELCFFGRIFFAARFYITTRYVMPLFKASYFLTPLYFSMPLYITKKNWVCASGFTVDDVLPVFKVSNIFLLTFS